MRPHRARPAAGRPGYAFPYDDVSPGPDFSGAVQAVDPDPLTVTVNTLR
ncbi:beta-1,3-glucanase family protein [Amycolatopsis sp. PS_44_ISF1]|nr:beta-1,3-glucanase family protein [Amycolatopsis sp. PS_44_ISF1]MDT8913419.1 beta-1,3-glucanase family protein [Amycolatopsis sp. PS_44_ISF1]